MRAPLIIAVAAALAGCGRELPHQVAAESCTDEHEFVYFNRTAADQPSDDDQPIERTSFETRPPTKETKFTIAPKTEEQPSHRARGRAHHATKKAKRTVIAAKVEAPATRVPPPPAASMTQLDANSNPAASSGTTGPNIANSRPTVSSAPNSNSRTIQEQVAAAIAVAERTTLATVAAMRDEAGPNAGASPSNTDLLVAIVMARPGIGAISDLAGQDAVMDDRYSASLAAVRIAIITAGGPLVQLSAGHPTAIDRLVNGEVSAAVLALVSADAAEGFPEIPLYRIFRVPLSLRPLKPQP